ncbi:MAG: hypothetical protein ACLPGW_19445 [Roseiarcus sp.]
MSRALADADLYYAGLAQSAVGELPKPRRGAPPAAAAAAGTPASDLLALRGGVVASLQAKLGASVDVDSHGGTFDLAEIKRFATLAPAVRVAIVGAGRASRFADGRWRVPVRFAAVIVTRDAAPTGAQKVPRDAAALLLASAIELAIASNRFGFEGVNQPEDVEARSEYSGPLDNLGVALWQVTWTSGVLLGAEGEPGDVVIAALTKCLVEGVATWAAPTPPARPASGLAGADPLDTGDNP